MKMRARYVSLLSVLWLAACPALSPVSGPSDSGPSSVGVAPLAPSGATHEDDSGSDATAPDNPAPSPSDPASPPPAATPMYRSLPAGSDVTANTPSLPGGVIAQAPIPTGTELSVVTTVNACTVERNPSALSVTVSGSARAHDDLMNVDNGTTLSWKKIPFVRLIVTPAKGEALCADFVLPDPDPATGRQNFSSTLVVPTLEGWDFYLSPTGFAIITPLPPADPATGLSVCPQNAALNLTKPDTFEWNKKSAPVLDEVKLRTPCPSREGSPETMVIPEEGRQRLQEMRRFLLQ